MVLHRRRLQCCKTLYNTQHLHLSSTHIENYSDRPPPDTQIIRNEAEGIIPDLLKYVVGQLSSRSRHCVLVMAALDESLSMV